MKKIIYDNVSWAGITWYKPKLTKLTGTRLKILRLIRNLIGYNKKKEWLGPMASSLNFLFTESVLSNVQPVRGVEPTANPTQTDDSRAAHPSGSSCGLRGQWRLPTQKKRKTEKTLWQMKNYIHSQVSRADRDKDDKDRRYSATHPVPARRLTIFDRRYHWLDLFAECLPSYLP